MRPRDLLVSCYFERDDDQWLAFCLDFTLVAQANTLEEARRKLEEQVRSYVADATVGEDRDHAATLLSRRAPLLYWLKFYAVLLQQHFLHRMSRKRSSVKEALPLVPQHCH